MVHIRLGIQHFVSSSATTKPVEHQKVNIHLTKRSQIFIANVYLPHIILTTPPTTKMTSHGSIIYQRNPASSVWKSILLRVPEMIMSLLTVGARRFTTGWKHTKRFCLTMVFQWFFRKPRGVIIVLESVRRMSRWSIRLKLIAPHVKPFQMSAQTTSCCCLSWVRSLKRSVAIPEDAPSTPKRIGFYSTNALTTYSCSVISRVSVQALGGLL